jgi:hypothetical protein
MSPSSGASDRGTELAGRDAGWKELTPSRWIRPATWREAL